MNGLPDKVKEYLEAKCPVDMAEAQQTAQFQINLIRQKESRKGNSKLSLTSDPGENKSSGENKEETEVNNRFNQLYARLEDLEKSLKSQRE